MASARSVPTPDNLVNLDAFRIAPARQVKRAVLDAALRGEVSAVQATNGTVLPCTLSSDGMDRAITRVITALTDALENTGATDADAARRSDLAARVLGLDGHGIAMVEAVLDPNMRRPMRLEPSHALADLFPADSKDCRYCAFRRLCGRG